MPRTEDIRRQVMLTQGKFMKIAAAAYPEQQGLDELRATILNKCYPDIFSQLGKLPIELQRELAIPLFASQFPNGLDFGSELIRIINFPWLKPSRELSRNELEALGRDAQVELGLEPVTSIIVKGSTKDNWDISTGWNAHLSQCLSQNRQIAANYERILEGAMSEEMADSLGRRSDRLVDNTILRIHLSHTLLQDITQIPTSPVEPMVRIFELGANPIGIINNAFYITVPASQSKLSFDSGKAVMTG